MNSVNKNHPPSWELLKQRVPDHVLIHLANPGSMLLVLDTPSINLLMVGEVAVLEMGKKFPFPYIVIFPQSLVEDVYKLDHKGVNDEQARNEDNKSRWG